MSADPLLDGFDDNKPDQLELIVRAAEHFSHAFKSAYRTRSTNAMAKAKAKCSELDGLLNQYRNPDQKKQETLF